MCYPVSNYQISPQSDHPRQSNDELLPVSYLMLLHFNHSSEVQNLSTDKISSTSQFIRWDITTSGLDKQTSAILEFFFRLRLRLYHGNRRAILHQTFRLYQIFSKSGHPRRSNDVIYIFQMKAAASPYYFRFRVRWYHSHLKVKVYHSLTHSLLRLTSWGS